jgi:NitT/TauT family transport system permease protein
MARLFPPLVALGLVLLAWHAATAWFGADPLILPPLGAIAKALHHGWVGGLLWPHAAATLQGTLAGLAIGFVAGVALGIGIAESRTLAGFLYPTVVALQSMPVVAIAPLLIVWLGIGLESKIFMAALVCFFPTFVNTVAGLQAARPELLDLFRAAGASRLHVLWHVKLPSAAHYLFVGLQISVVLSLTGCVVAEFIAAKAGLGYLIKSVSGQLDVAMMFAAILSLAALGAAGGLAVKALHRAVVFWERSERIAR